MRFESMLVLLALVSAALTPCTCGAGAVFGAACAAAGVVVAWRGERSPLAPALALLVNLFALAAAVVLAAVAAFAGVAASVTALNHAPDVARRVWSSLSPAGFWAEFHRGELVVHESDQGPRGGRRSLHWRAERDGAFDAEEVARFASDNGWTLHSSERVRFDVLELWSATCQRPRSECDPLTDHVRSGCLENYITLPSKLRRTQDGEIHALSFDTGWVQYDDYEGRAWTVVGYAFLSADGRELIVEHHWGE